MTIGSGGRGIEQEAAKSLFLIPDFTKTFLVSEISWLTRGYLVRANSAALLRACAKHVRWSRLGKSSFSPRAAFT